MFDLRHAVERRERGLRGGVDERQVRLIGGQVRRDAERAVARERRVGGGVRARERVAGDARNRRHADGPRQQRARRLTHGGPRRQRIDRRRQRIEIAAEPAGALRRARVAGGPDVGALEMRAARVRIAGALDDRQPAGVEDASSGRRSRGCKPERVAGAVGADLQHVRRRNRERRPPA